MITAFSTPQVLSWRDEKAIIIGPNVPISRFRGNFLPAHLEPGFPGAQQEPR